jgi:hypothetical protein
MHNVTETEYRGSLGALHFYQDHSERPMWFRIATFDAPWLGWKTEATCDLAKVPGDEHYKYGYHRLRVGTLWCWIFLALLIGVVAKIARR